MSQENHTDLPPRRKSTALSVVQHLLTIGISVGVCWYFLRRMDWHQLRRHMEGVNWWLAGFGVALPNLAWWIADAYMDRKVVEWFHSKVAMWGIFWMRGVTYMMMVVFPPLSEGGMALYLYRKTGMSLRLISGIFFFKLANMVFAVVAMLFIATLVAYGLGFHLDHYITVWWWWAMLGIGLLLIFHAWSYWIKKHSWGPLDRLLPRDDEFFRPFNQSTLGQWAIIWIGTIIPYLLLYVGYYLTVRTFHITKVPFLLWVLLSPVVLTVSGLPIFFSGFGGTTALWEVFFFQGHPGTSAEINVVAVTFFIPAARMVVRMVVGLVSLLPAPKDLALFWKGRGK
jgi:hypothetical protein